MPLKKLTFRAGVNRENTRYTNENGWYFSDKVRFRQGTPEKIGGWQQISNDTYLGTARSLWPWTSYIGVGTNLKYYLEYGGGYYDITPIRSTVVLTNPFTTSFGLTTVVVTAVSHGCVNGDFVTFSGASAVGGLTITGEYQITLINDNSYSITASATASSSATGGGTVTAAYQLNVGNSEEVPLSGWGAGGWGLGAWGTGSTVLESLRIWNHYNFGADLIYGPKGGGMYYWTASSGPSVRGVALSSLSGASDVPLMQNLLIVSDASRIVLAFGTNDYGSVTQDNMLIRWSDQENAAMWTPNATNQAGSLRLSHGSAIQAVAQVRQEILIWTDVALYSLQYVGAPNVWQSQLLSDNTSIISDRAWATAAGVTYWMGNEKFYVYDGRTNNLVCDLRQYIFSDFNFNQSQQVFAGTNEQFNEIWWFYCSSSSSTIDRYAIYNYVEKVWYYGTMARTAWIDTSAASVVPIAADYNKRLLYHETGVDDNATTTTQAISAYITSAEFDIDDGSNFGFVWRVIPDLNFTGSTSASPTVNISLLALQNSGSGYNNPESVAGSNEFPVVRTATVPVEKYTGQINIRIRGRQMSLKISSDALGVQWQAGSMRLDIRQDGRKS